MKRLALIFYIFLVTGLSVQGQESSVTEYDLHGCWIFEWSENQKRPEKIIYKTCKKSDSNLTHKVSKITFLIHNQCEFQEVQPSPILCKRTLKTIIGSWNYNKNSGIVKIFYPKNHEEEYWKKVKKEYPHVTVPDPRLKKQFRVIGLKNGQLEIEKLSTRKP